MASGSSGRAGSGSKGFDFGSDDILCSYDDFNNTGNQDHSDGALSDSAIGTNSSTKEFHKSRMSRSPYVPSPAYNQHEESLNQEVVAAVERSMKKYSDNLLRFLEGISSRMSQLELYCYNLDKSIGEMRSELVRDHGEADMKLKSLDKHLQEVHRSVQILRDKQELADTQKELAKLQLAQKETTSANRSQQSEERAATPPCDDTSDVPNQHLALALPHQVAPRPQPSVQARPVEQQQPMAPPSQAAPQNVVQPQPYYLPAQVPAQSQPTPGQYMPSDPQYRTAQVQDISRVPPQAPQPQMNQTPPAPPSQLHQFPQYQQQCSGVQQLPQQVQPSQQQQQPPSMQPQIRPQTAASYPPYQTSQQMNPSPPEELPSSMMQIPFSGVAQSGTSRADVMAYGYGGRTGQQQPPPQQIKGPYGGPTDGYSSVGPQHPSHTPGSAYMIYGGEERTQIPLQQPHFSQGTYPPPSSLPPQNLQQPSISRTPGHPQQFARNHPYNELIEKLVNMGFRSDHVMNVIQRMEEAGQPIDFNAVLDRLNVHSSGGPQRGWSG